METTALSGGFADAPVDAARAFRAALQAMSRPGSIHTVAGALPPAPLSVAAGVLLLTLADPETPLALVGEHDCQAVRDWVTFQCGAPLCTPSDAALSVGRWPALGPLDAYPIGTAEYPDRSATLIVETETLTPNGARLTGPGIERDAHLSVPDVAALQRNGLLFPQGLDFFLCAGDRLAALPRTTKVEPA